VKKIVEIGQRLAKLRPKKQRSGVFDSACSCSSAVALPVQRDASRLSWAVHSCRCCTSAQLNESASSLSRRLGFVDNASHRGIVRSLLSYRDAAATGTYFIYLKHIRPTGHLRCKWRQNEVKVMQYNKVLC